MVFPLSLLGLLRPLIKDVFGALRVVGIKFCSLGCSSFLFRLLLALPLILESSANIRQLFRRSSTRGFWGWQKDTYACVFSIVQLGGYQGQQAIESFGMTPQTILRSRLILPSTYTAVGWNIGKLRVVGTSRLSAMSTAAAYESMKNKWEHCSIKIGRTCIDWSIERVKVPSSGTSLWDALTVRGQLTRVDLIFDLISATKLFVRARSLMCTSMGDHNGLYPYSSTLGMEE